MELAFILITLIICLTIESHNRKAHREKMEKLSHPTPEILNKRPRLTPLNGPRTEDE